MSKPGRFFWKLFLGNAMLMAVVLGASVWLIIAEVERGYRENLTHQLLAQAVTIRHHVRDQLEPLRATELEAAAREFGAIREADLRITIMTPNGDVLADSEAAAGQMEPHAGRPEIVQALREGWGHAERESTTVRRTLKYVAARVDSPAGRPIGIVRVAMPIPEITAQTATMNRLIWRTAALALAGATCLALGLAYIWSMPIRRITDAALSISRGNLTTRTPVTGGDEIAQMATSLNHLRDSIEAQLQTIDLQRRNLASLIRSLSEGVIVASSVGRIVLMNEAALRLLDMQPTAAPPPRGGREEDWLHPDQYVGRPASECIRQPQVRDFLSNASASISKPDGKTAPRTPRPMQEFRIEIRREAGTLFLLARGSEIELPGTGPAEGAGRLIVLTDITELTRTIRMKTDFVANASHELRTPLSTIRASVETLEQMNIADDPSAAAHFVQMVSRQTSRLEELVDDLLNLSRLESAAAEFRPENLRLDEFLDELEARFHPRIIAKSLHWNPVCPANCREIVANPRLLRLVLDNLVSNAIKFTEPGGNVWIACARLGPSISIEVRDDGCGIPIEDQDRVFERFYQVERARSGVGGQHMGNRGTGLGLSIVRHAVGAMQGTVLLKSLPGKGTSVTVFIPQPA